MLFEREKWHSGLTYEQTCEQCKSLVRYKDHLLDFRPWYADGFIYCPNCHKVLRHKEEYAVDRTADLVIVDATANVETGTAAMCVECGHQFLEGDRFCSQCGAKRP